MKTKVVRIQAAPLTKTLWYSLVCSYTQHKAELVRETSSKAALLVRSNMYFLFNDILYNYCR